MRRTLVIGGMALMLGAMPAGAATRGCEVERGIQKGLQAIVALDGRQVVTDRAALFAASHPFEAVSDSLRHLVKTVVFNQRRLGTQQARYAGLCKKGSARPFCVQLHDAIVATQARILTNQKQIDRLRQRAAGLAAALLPLEQRLDNDRTQLAADLGKLADARAAYLACQSGA